MHLTVTLTLAAVSLTAGIIAYLITVRRYDPAPKTEAETLQAACMRAAAKQRPAYTSAASPKKP